MLVGMASSVMSLEIHKLVRVLFANFTCHSYQYNILEMFLNLVRNQIEAVCLILCLTWYEDRIKGSKNFNRAYIDGSGNLRTSSFRDHARSDMHERALSLLKKEQSSLITEYCPLFRSFAKMDA